MHHDLPESQEEVTDELISTGYFVNRLFHGSNAEVCLDKSSHFIPDDDAPFERLLGHSHEHLQSLAIDATKMDECLDTRICFQSIRYRVHDFVIEIIKDLEEKP